MSELLQSVKSIFDSVKSCTFNIPAYQRGYKWSRQDVQVLLDDLLKFEVSNKTDLSKNYCLQNITLVSISNKDLETKTESIAEFNVVDGQQRLTTLYILLSYLRAKKLPDFILTPTMLKYNIRTETADFLQKQVATGKLWEQKIDLEHVQHKDEWYIRDVADGIDDWFRRKTLDANTILQRVQLIVNILSETNEEKIFAGLNGGKVDLDGADLVRAELITRSAQERFICYNSNTKQIESRINEYRVRIGMELDEMNRWWSEPDHIMYFEQLLPNEAGKNRTFLYKQYPIDLLYLLYYECDYNIDTTKEELDFRFFEHGRDTNGKLLDHDHWELLESVISLHHTMKDWYEDRDLFHWIGYLFFNFKGRIGLHGEVITFRNIYRKWGQWKKWEVSNPIQLKSDFLKEIQNQIRYLLVSPYLKDDNIISCAEGEERMLNSIADLNEDWYADGMGNIAQVLTLLDILICTSNYKYPNDKKGELGKANRLPVEYLSRNSEDKEHIRSCTPNAAEGKDVTSREEWINHINRLYNNSIDNEEIALRDSLINILQTKQELELSNTEIEEMNRVMNSHAQNSIGNLVLLDNNVNRSYQNNPFQSKIQRITMEFMKKKRIIRPFTLLVFLSKMQQDDTTWRWTKKDIEENAKNIQYQITNFLNQDIVWKN